MSTWVTLRGFGRSKSSPTRYSLDTVSGTYTATDSPIDTSTGCAGWGTEPMIGVLRRSRTFTAIYALGGRLYVRVGDLVCDWMSSEYAAHSRLIAPFVRCFEIRRHGEVILTTHYRAVGVHEWPASEMVDIFRFIEAKTKTRREVAAFIYFWDAAMAGRDVESQAFVDEIKGYLQRLGA